MYRNISAWKLQALFRLRAMANRKVDHENAYFLALCNNVVDMHIAALKGSKGECHLFYHKSFVTYSGVESFVKVHQQFLLSALAVAKLPSKDALEAALKRFATMRGVDLDVVVEAKGIKLMISSIGRSSRNWESKVVFLCLWLCFCKCLCWLNVFEIMMRNVKNATRTPEWLQTLCLAYQQAPNHPLSSPPKEARPNHRLVL